MDRARIIFLFLLLMLGGRILFAQDVAASSTAPGASQPASAPQPAATAPAIPVGDLFAQSDALQAQLRASDAQNAASPEVEDISEHLAGISQETPAREQETQRILSTKPSLENLASEEAAWESFSETFEGWKKTLLARGSALDGQIADLQQQANVWQGWQDAAKKADAAHQADPAHNPAVPADVITRIASAVRSLQDAMDRATAARSQVLSLEAQVAQQEDAAAAVLQNLRDARDEATRQLFAQDSPPIWHPFASAPATRPGREPVTWGTRFGVLAQYVRREKGRFIAQGVVLGLLLAGLYWARARFKTWRSAEPTLAPAAPVFELPLAAALVVSLLLGLWLYPQAPRLFWPLAAAVVIVPATALIRRLVEPHLAPLIYALVSLFFVDQFRSMILSFPPWPRFVFLAEMLAAVVFLLAFIRANRRTADVGPRGHMPVVLAGCRLALALLVAAFVGNALGYGRLGLFLGNAVLRSAYLALILYSALAVADGLVIVLLHVKLFARLHSVKKHAALLRQRTRRILNWAAAIVWIYLALRLLYISGPVFDVLQRILSTPAHLGGFTISLGQILSGVITIWAAFAISRFIRFLLDEDVYPHVSLPRGLSNAVSMIIHYAVLVIGFGIAIALLGYPVTQLTILTGAFGVGLGFGLQTIINNFFSGIIVLAERPVRVGDIIEMDGIAGTITRIGIRATVYRTADGSEIIMPNARLISERVINWTFTDRDRGFEITLSVDAAADPKHVMDLLEQTARTFPGIAAAPAPAATLTGLAGGSLNLSLTASAQNINEWKRVKSGLLLAICAALRKENIPIK